MYGDVPLVGVTVALPVAVAQPEGVEFTVAVIVPAEVTATVCVFVHPLASVRVTV